MNKIFTTAVQLVKLLNQIGLLMPTHLIKHDETYHLAARFYAVFQRVSEFTKERTPDDFVAQLSVNQLRALRFIRREPGISQKALAEKLEVTSAAVSMWISKLIDAEFVQKYPSEDDARMMCLYLGPAGQELIRTFEQTQIEIIAGVLHGMPRDEQQIVVEALERALAIREQEQSAEHAASV